MTSLSTGADRIAGIVAAHGSGIASSRGMSFAEEVSVRSPAPDAYQVDCEYREVFVEAHDRDYIARLWDAMAPDLEAAATDLDVTHSIETTRRGWVLTLVASVPMRPLPTP